MFIDTSTHVDIHFMNQKENLFLNGIAFLFPLFNYFQYFQHESGLFSTHAQKKAPRFQFSGQREWENIRCRKKEGSMRGEGGP